MTLTLNSDRAQTQRAAAADFYAGAAPVAPAAPMLTLAERVAAGRAAALAAGRVQRAAIAQRTAQRVTAGIPRTAPAAPRPAVLDGAATLDAARTATSAATAGRAANRARCAADADPIGTCGISDARGAALAALPDDVQRELATLAIRMCAYVVINLDGRVDADGELDAAAVTCAAASILGTLDGCGSWEDFHASLVSAVRLARHAARADRARAAQTQMSRTIRVDPSELVTLSDAQVDTARCTVTRLRDCLPAAFVVARTCGAEIAIVDAIACPEFTTQRARTGDAAVMRAAGLVVDGRARKVSQMRVARTRRALRGAGAAVRYRVLDAGRAPRTAARWTQDAALTAARLTYVRPAMPSRMPLDALRTYEFPVTVTRV